MEKIPTGMLSPEAERYFGTLLEQLNGKFDQLLEGFFTLEAAMKRLEVRIDRLEARMEFLETRMDYVEIQLEKIGKELKEIRVELKLCVRRDEFCALEKRVTKIEQALAQ